ncbi:single-stranded DNA-binding protein [Eubacteriales bacterium OttesenSCG-928-M02]|nr:single-stranded DNA-binding protein [Eubacteriales bacterium OttesenSCG-928-M02]
MNKAILIGNITRDPDLRMTGNGISVCSFTVAVQRRYTNQQGERQADFIPVVCWRGLAENCGKYLRKGSKVGVLGAIQVRNYEANDGTRRYVTEIVADEVEFLDRAGDRQNADPNSQFTPQDTPSPFSDSMGFGDAVDDDELPF